MASREYSDETPRKDNLNEGLESLSSQELEGLRDECARTALALTALFDGEANVEEALLARTHRDECAQCDFLWQSWNHQNQSLRHLSAPVPPALLTRILTAIRLLAAMPQMRARLEAKTTRFEPQTGTVSDARLLSEVVFAAGVNPFAPRRSAQRYTPKIEAPRELPPLDPMAPLPPSHLRDEILRRTVGANRGTIPVLPSHEKGDVALAFELQRSVRPRRAMRFSATVVPVLAAWLIFLAGPSGLWAPLLESRPSQPEALLVKRLVAKAQAISAATTTMKPTVQQNENIALANGSDENSRVKQERTAQPEKQSIIIEQPIVVTAQRNEANSAAPAVSAIVPVSVPQPSAQPTREQPVATPAVRKVAIPQVAMLPKVTPAPHRRPATTMADMEIRTRHSSWSAPSPAIPASRRSVWDAAADSRVAAPQPKIADNTDNEADAETLEHVNRLNDARPEDVRNILDGYRASLLAENPDDVSLTIPQG